jgi:chitinase
MIAIGGWTDSQTIDNFNKYSALVASDRNIEKFVDSAVKFLKEYRFDGLDLDWEYPSTAQDKNGFSKLISALKRKFKPHGYLLSAAVPGSSDAITKGRLYIRSLYLKTK